MGFLGKCMRNSILAKKSKLADKFFSKKGNENKSYQEFLEYYDNFVNATVESKRNSHMPRYVQATFSATITACIEHEEVVYNVQFEVLVPDYIYTDTDELLEYVEQSNSYIEACNPRINDVSDLIEVARFL